MKNDSLNMKIPYNNNCYAKLGAILGPLQKSWLVLNMQRDDPGMNWNLNLFFFCLIMMCLYCQTKSSSYLLFHLRSFCALLLIVSVFWSYLGEHSEVSQARSLHVCWTRMLYHDRLETINNSQSTNSAKMLKIFNVYSSLGL